MRAIIHCPLRKWFRLRPCAAVFTQLFIHHGIGLFQGGNARQHRVGIQQRANKMVALFAPTLNGSVRL